MKLDSARELVDQLARSLDERLAGKTINGHAAAFHGEIGSDERSSYNRPSVAFGFRSLGKEDSVGVIIRIQNRMIRELTRRRKSGTIVEMAELDRNYGGEVQKRFIGEVRPLSARRRPPMIGGSIGHHKMKGFGTIGAYARLRGTPQSALGVISNNHVLARDNKLTPSDDHVVQPAYGHGGRHQEDTIGKLERLTTLDFSGLHNRVDGAFAILNGDIQHVVGMNHPGDLPNGKRILGVRRLTAQEAASGEVDSVMKFGCKTKRTTGKISGFALKPITVKYQPGGSAQFVDLFEVEGSGGSTFSEPGDSGSLVLDKDGYAIGVVFAGTAAKVAGLGINLTYAIPIGSFLDALNVDLVL